MGASPLSSTKVLHPARVLAGDALGVANQQGADLVPYRKGDYLLGSLMLGLVDATAMASLRPPHANPVTAPPSRPALPTLRGSPGRPATARLLVV
jgi:hypothetical protein